MLILAMLLDCVSECMTFKDRQHGWAPRAMPTNGVSWAPRERFCRTSSWCSRALANLQRMNAMWLLFLLMFFIPGAEAIHTDVIDESPFNLLTNEKLPCDLGFKCAVFALINVIICAVGWFAWSFTEFSTHWSTGLCMDVPSFCHCLVSCPFSCPGIWMPAPHDVRLFVLAACCHFCAG